MSTTLPDNIRDTLSGVGQVAAELPCQIDGYREFVTVFKFQPSRVIGFVSQFPYLANCKVAYRLMRFRVDADMIRDDRDCCNSDLIGLQSIHVPTEEDVQSILKIWHVAPEMLRQPKETEVPI